MKHYIIVKFKEDAPRLDDMIGRIEEIFRGVLEVRGVESFKLVRNCIDRSNRYDLMIVIQMDKNSLPDYDESIPHHTWKEEFSKYIEKKAIFDAE